MEWMSDQRITTVVLDSITLDALRRLALRRAELEGGRASASRVIRALIHAEAHRAKVQVRAPKPASRAREAARVD